MLKKGDVFYYANTYSDSVEKCVARDFFIYGKRSSEYVGVAGRSYGVPLRECFHEKEDAEKRLEQYRKEYKKQLENKEDFLDEIEGCIWRQESEGGLSETQGNVLIQMLKERVT